MTPSHLHQMLIQACEEGNIESVKKLLEEGVDLNFDIKSPLNALSSAIQSGHQDLVKLLLEQGALVKPLVLQKAIEKDTSYLKVLLPKFHECRDEMLLLSMLQAAINCGDSNLAKQAIMQGAKPQSLPFYAIKNLESPTILALLLNNGFDFYTNANRMVSQWMGSAATDQTTRLAKVNLVAFISSYYLENPTAIKKLSTLILDKTRLFGLGLNTNDFKMMKFAILLGFDRSEAINATLYRYYTQDTKNHAFSKLDYDIVEYLLSEDIPFKKVTISNAVGFNYSELLRSLSHQHDLEYAYEVAYTYQKQNLCDYFIKRGVSKELQRFVKMKVATLQGKLDLLREAIAEGAKIEALDRAVILEVINQNQVKMLEYLNALGVKLDTFFNPYLNTALNKHHAYESVSYLIELGLDISYVKEIPSAYKKRYPILFDMWERKFKDIFDYTLFLVQEIYPTVEDNQKESLLKQISELSALPYVLRKSKQKETEG